MDVPIRHEKFNRANSIGGKITPALTIEFLSEVGDFDNLKAWEAFANVEGERLANILLDTLPQGVADKMIGHLLLKRSSLFIGPMFSEIEEDD